jgi:putative thioredoxin
MDNSINVSEETFQAEVINRSSEIPVVVDFWAPWCVPCRTLSPILEKLATDPDFTFILAKVNVDQNPNLSMRYRVQGIPAVKAFVDGEVVSEFVGLQPEGRIRDFLRKLIPDEAEEAISNAKSLLATQHWAAAEDAFFDLLEDYPHRADVNLGIARALLAQGEGCDALNYLEKIRDGKELTEAERLKPLAHFLCRTVLTEDDQSTADPLTVQYEQTAVLIGRGNFAAAMDGLIDVLRQNKRFRKGEPREVMLGLFELLGNDNTLTTQYRQELASVLY